MPADYHLLFTRAHENTESTPTAYTYYATLFPRPGGLCTNEFTLQIDMTETSRIIIRSGDEEHLKAFGASEESVAVAKETIAECHNSLVNGSGQLEVKFTDSSDTWLADSETGPITSVADETDAAMDLHSHVFHVAIGKDYTEEMAEKTLADLDQYLTCTLPPNGPDTAAEPASKQRRFLFKTITEHSIVERYAYNGMYADPRPFLRVMVALAEHTPIACEWMRKQSFGNTGLVDKSHEGVFHGM